MFQKIMYRIDILKRIRFLAIGVRKLFVVNFFAAVAGLALALGLPVLYSVFIEKIILGGRIHLLLPIILGYVGIQLANSGIAFLRNYCGYRINNQVTVKMKEKILNNLLNRPFTDYENLNVGEQKMIMDDAVIKMCDFTNTQTVEYVIDYCKMILLLGLLFVLEWHLAFILVVAIPVTFWMNHMIGKKARKNNDESWENDQAMGAWIYASLNGWREIRAWNLEEACRKTFVRYAQRDSELFITFIEYWVARVLIIPKIKDEFLMQFLLYFLGGILIFKGNITIGSLLVFAQYYTQLVDTVQKVVTADADLQVNTIHYEKALAAMEEEIPEKQEKKKEVRNCDLIFQNVTFSYEAGTAEILHDFSMEIKQGERVGIVGESGKGKTTLLKMIVGMLEPAKGTIWFGGEELSDLSLQMLHSKIGFVLQENMLFNTTICENLLYGNENATQEEIVRACKKAYIHEFVQSLPDGYETVIGEKGIKLSGGQKQRLVLARLFLRNVDMYIFDEATSALDQNAEHMVQQAIRNISRDKTIIVVAHRKSSLRLCDRLIYI